MSCGELSLRRLAGAPCSQHACDLAAIHEIVFGAVLVGKMSQLWESQRPTGTKWICQGMIARRGEEEGGPVVGVVGVRVWALERSDGPFAPRVCTQSRLRARGRCRRW